MFLWSFFYAFILCFIVPVVWNLFYRWPVILGILFLVTSLFMTSLVAIVFDLLVCQSRKIDLHRLFQALGSNRSMIG